MVGWQIRWGGWEVISVLSPKNGLPHLFKTLNTAKENDGEKRIKIPSSHQPKLQYLEILA